MAGNQYVHKHNDDRGANHYYVRTDYNYVLHDDGSHYYVKHDDQHHYNNLNDNHGCHHCTAYDDEHDGIAVHDNHGRPYIISRSCPVHDCHHVLRAPASASGATSDDESACTGDDSCPYAYDIYHYYEHHTAPDDDYKHDDNDYLHDTAADHDYSDTDEHDDPADYEHLLTGYEDSFHHDRKFISFPVISSPEAKRLLDLAIQRGLGGSYNADHHVSAGGDNHNDSSTTAT